MASCAADGLHFLGTWTLTGLPKLEKVVDIVNTNFPGAVTPVSVALWLTRRIRPSLSSQT
jgi:hypothetical protein